MLALLTFAVVGVVFGRLRYQFTMTDLVAVLILLLFSSTALRSPQVIESGRLTYSGVLVPVLTYFVTRLLLNDEKRLHQALFFAGFGIGVFAIIYILIVSGVGERGVILNVPEISAATLFFVGLVVALMAQSASYFFRALLFFACFLALVLTFSRAYLLLTVLLPLLFAAIRRGHTVSVMTSFLVISLAGTLWLGVGAIDLFEVAKPIGDKKGYERVLQSDFWLNALAKRAGTIRDGLENFESSPLFGTGLQRDGYSGATRHSLHVAWLEYGGVFGYALFVTLMLTHSWRAGKVVHADSASAYSFVIVLVLCVNALTNGIFHGAMPIMLFLFLAVTESRYMQLRSSIRANDVR